MSGEQILITHEGQTVQDYASCGDHFCTVTVLRCLGVPEKDAADAFGVSDLEMGDDTQITCVSLGESDSDEWCAACGEFIRHGLNCDCGDKDKDPKGLNRPHIDLRDSPPMKKFLEQR